MNLSEVLESINITLSETQLQQLEQYADILTEWNQHMNLTAITDREGIYIRHFGDSLLIETLFHPQDSLIDVGSGAGFPGLPLAIARPDLNVTLLEPLEKRCRFLNHVVEQLQLNNVTVIRQRAEEHQGHYRYAVSRAVAAMNILSELCLPLVETDGHFIAVKGPKVYQEAEEAKDGISLLGGEIASLQEAVLPDGQTTVLADIVKVRETPKGYPRPFGRIKKNPL